MKTTISFLCVFIMLSMVVHADVYVKEKAERKKSYF